MQSSRFGIGPVAYHQQLLDMKHIYPTVSNSGPSLGARATACGLNVSSGGGGSELFLHRQPGLRAPGRLQVQLPRGHQIKDDDVNLESGTSSNATAPQHTSSLR